VGKSLVGKNDYQSLHRDRYPQSSRIRYLRIG